MNTDTKENKPKKFPDDKTEFSVEEAAEYVELSRRTFERMPIESRDEKRMARDNKMRTVRIFDRAVLDQVKAEIAASKVRPGVVMQNNDVKLPPVISAADLPAIVGLLIDQLAEKHPKLLAASTEKSEAPPAKRAPINISLFADKLIMNFKEARAFSGLKGDDLKSALDSGRIAAKHDGGRWQIQRKSLENYVENYFAG